MNRRRFFSAGFVPLGIVAAALPVLAQQDELPQPTVPDFGLQLPWFRSRAENLRREACAQNRPDCRADTRRQMQIERTITWTTPFLIVGGLVLVALFYARKLEKEKLARRAKAQRGYVPGRFRKHDKEAKQKESDEDEDDSL